jgi:hypothetical protein
MCDGSAPAKAPGGALLAVALALLAAAPPSFAAGDPAAGWTRGGRALRFVGKDLYGHIDGGAELFYEFGFRDLTVERWVRGDRSLVVERYRMESPPAALGIDLALGGGAEPIGGLGERSSGSRFQLCALQGDLFVLVNNEAGDETLLPAMTALASRAIEGTKPGGAEKLLDLLPREHLVAGSERLIRGPYSLQAVFTFGEGDILRLGGKIFGAAGNYEGGEDSAWTLIRVPYAAPEEAKEAFAHLVRNLDPYLEVIRSDGDRLLFRDYRGEYGDASPVDRLLQLKVGLSDQPK